ncbi:MAG: hypothetical protein M1409_08495 [Actinobacteria bacterium]|nr:hypothetical protein [Actinomycetota bacterium]
MTFTRSRAYHKNDGCYVEQKNWSVVRKTVGYWRYDTPKTPYQRILDNNEISSSDKEKLQVEYKYLNPVQLKREMAKYESQLFNAIYKKVRLKKLQKQLKKRHELQTVLG